MALARRATALVEDVRRHEDRLALVLSVLVGALVGLVVVAFMLLTGRLAAHMYPTGSAAGWRRLIVPIVGSGVTGFLLFRYFPDARGSGIPQTKAAILIHDGRITLRTVVGKFVCCAGSLASGIALGREGPSVQIGGGIASVIARRLGLSVNQVRWLVPVGASAALAAAFNTPIAAVLFALEEIMGDMHSPILGSVVLSSTTSWMVLHLVMGDEPLFHVAPYQLVAPSELLAYVVLGVVGGLASVAFTRLLLRLRLAFRRLPASGAWWHPVVGGVCVGVLGYFVPAVLGVGYDQVDRVLSGDVLLRGALLLAGLKIIATSVCYASGNAGGIFGPTMFIGAMIGASVGHVMHGWFPASTASAGAYALVGMGSAFAGIIRTPLTSVIMIFEVTRNYTIIVPLMISNLIAFYISQRLQHEPIYEALARQDGVHLPTGAHRHVSARLRVSKARRAAPAGLSRDTLLADAQRHAAATAVDVFPVFDGDDFIEMIRVADIAAAVSRGSSATTIGELLDESRGPDGVAPAVHVHDDHALATALARMGEAGRTVLPVVSRANARILLGVVALTDVLSAYGVESTSDLTYVEDDDDE